MVEIVYFIQSKNGGPIKIGLSRRPVKRLKSLQIGRHDELQIVAQAQGTLADERGLHSKFAKYRLQGEWFEPCEELMALIDELNRSRPELQCLPGWAKGQALRGKGMAER